jgi:hypothetical protein
MATYAGITHSALTRFNNRGIDGPESGSIGIWASRIDGAATTVAATYTRDMLLPIGMKIAVLNVEATAGTITGTPLISVGTSAATTATVAAVALTTGLGALTIKAAGNLLGQTATATRVRVTVAAATGEAAANVNVTMVYYVAQAPTSAFVRGQGHF